MSIKFSKKHYEQVADTIGRIYEDIREDPNNAGHYILTEFETLFAEDNPRFNSVKFETRVCRAQEAAATERQSFLDAEKRFEQAGGQLDEHPYDDVPEFTITRCTEEEERTVLERRGITMCPEWPPKDIHVNGFHRMTHGPGRYWG